MRLIALFCLIAFPAVAQQRATDTPFTGADLATTLSGQTLEFFDDSAATYRDDGTYIYRYTPDGDPWEGVWATEDSEVCVVFDNGFGRCDLIVTAGERLVLIIEDGTRYPVRAIYSAAE